MLAHLFARCIALAAPSGRQGRSLSEFWDHADPTFSHIAYDRWLGSERKLVRTWAATWLDRFAMDGALPPRSARVLEYGIGGGLLGELLLRNYSTAHYTGLDVSARQLSNAARRLCERFPGSAFSLRRVDELPAIESGNYDALVSQAVIQHFPNMAYARHFFATIDAGDVPFLMLQTRETKGNTSKGLRCHAVDDGASPSVEGLDDEGSAGSTYARDANVKDAYCVTSTALVSLLPSYEETWRSQRLKSNGYVFHILRKRRSEPLPQKRRQPSGSDSLDMRRLLPLAVEAESAFECANNSDGVFL